MFPCGSGSIQLWCGLGGRGERSCEDKITRMMFQGFGGLFELSNDSCWGVPVLLVLGFWSKTDLVNITASSLAVVVFHKGYNHVLRKKSTTVG